ETEHELITALCVLYKGTEITHEVITRIQLHPLSLEQIENYVDLDEPLDCAGSYKIESHGISLMARIETEDFSAIQGLPLLALGKILRSCGYVFPQGGLK
ncbi:MAG: Maf family protein, partial [Bdellovibrionaceae bacterium]|nr:Maf family protein [Pseudobdellovibrionaceae bacterium]